LRLWVPLLNSMIVQFRNVKDCLRLLMLFALVLVHPEYYRGVATFRNEGIILTALRMLPILAVLFPGHLISELMG
jgi:hypothetical protein